MATSKDRRIANHLVNRESDRGIVRGNNGAGAGADQDPDGNLMTLELSEDSEMRGASKAAGAQNDPDSRAVGIHRYNWQ